MIQSLLSKELSDALGWTVLHSLWQAFVVGIVLALLLVFLQKHSAKLRYFLSNCAMLIVLVWSIFTFLNLYNSNTHLPEGVSILNLSISESSGSFLQNLYQNFSQYFNTHLPLIVTVWLIGVALFMLRMLGGLAYIEHLKYRHNQPLSEFWQTKLRDLSDKIPLKQTVGLVESALVKVPMVVGYFKPVILMPVGAVNNLSMEQVEAILAHELAHIYRNDYLLNIFQTIIETLFYFNPAVWWISANIRSERENCCDDIAVKVCGNSIAYAKALVSLQEMHQAAPILAMPFSKNKNQLLNRVKRILNQPQNKSNIMEKFTATLMLLVAIIMLSYGSNMPFENLWVIDNFEENISELHVVYENEFEEEEEEIYLVKPTKKDTIPQGKTRIKKEKRGDIEIRMENGEVTELKVDGKEVSKEEYGEYEGEISELKEIANEIPEPPAPPAYFFTPSPPNVPAPPAPPAPPAVEEIPAPPSPSKAPTAPFWKEKKTTRTITTEKEEGGMTKIIIEQEGGNEPIEIKVKADENGVIVIDGEEIKDLEEGDRMIIVEEYSNNNSSNYFFFDSEEPVILNGEDSPFAKLKKLKGYKEKDKPMKNKDKKKWKEKDSQGNIWEFKEGKFDELFDTYENLAYSPEVNLKDVIEGELPLEAEPNLNLKFDYLLEIPDLKETQLHGYIENPELFNHLNVVTPNARGEEFKDYNNLIQRLQDEYQERLKDGNVGEQWMKEWSEKLKKELPEGYQNELLFNDPNFKIKGQSFDFYYNTTPKIKRGNKGKVMVLPTPSSENMPKAIYIKGSSTTIE